MVNAHIVAESDQRTRQSSSQCCSFSKNMKLPTKKGGGSGVGPNIVRLLEKFLGGTRFMGKKLKGRSQSRRGRQQ